MSTVELIARLRETADKYPDDADLIREAADRLEDLDERVAIMMENEPGGDDGFGEST